MPNYYNSYGGNYMNPQMNVPYLNQYAYQQPPVAYSASAYGMQGNNYWISVDGEMAARAWQMPPNLAPNTIIPLWDLDGQHVYFKSTDAYGRINPLRKGKVIFDDTEKIAAGESNASVNVPSGTNYVGDSRTENNYVTREDFEGLRHEIQDMLRQQREQFQNNVAETAGQSMSDSTDQNTQTKGYTANQNGNGNFKNIWKKNG